jgi:SAM-dependent methyltransferase
MLRYMMTAAALKSFSLSPQTRRLYRWLGNTLGQRERIKRGLETPYMDRARKILELFEKEQAIRDGDRLLEIGTGWVHWEATVLRLFYDVEITLFDVWDNRHLGAYKRYMAQLDEIIDDELSLDPPHRARIHRLLRAIAAAGSFDEIYDVLGFRYVINPGGTLDPFEDESFAAVFSWNVLEHVNRRILPSFIRDFGRLLQPGGCSIHKIDPGDHLAYYETGVSHKNYLRYSDGVWRRFFENDVQYFNRVQRPEWLDLFQTAKLDLVHEEVVGITLNGMRINKRYQRLSRQDLECVSLTFIHRKPIANDLGHSPAD